MHLIATYYPVCTDCALRTSEKVPSPNFLIKRYSIEMSQISANEIWSNGIYPEYMIPRQAILTVHFVLI
jgi:hypothetical protein